VLSGSGSYGLFSIGTRRLLNARADAFLKITRVDRFVKGAVNRG
jgi:hypothetical protein